MGKELALVKVFVRRYMAGIAAWLHKISGGSVTPDAITWIGFVMHIPIALLIADNYLVVAAILLIIFGLFDTLDGELARLQKRSSASGMLLDASTDRMKEVLLYGGIAYYFAISTHPEWAVWAALALGASITVSYVKAKGEAAVASATTKIDHHTLNRMFSDGLLTFEVRMALLVVGLLTGYLVWAVAGIAIGASFTAFQRLQRIRSNLS